MRVLHSKPSADEKNEHAQFMWQTISPQQPQADQLDQTERKSHKATAPKNTSWTTTVPRREASNARSNQVVSQPTPSDDNAFASKFYFITQWCVEMEVVNESFIHEAELSRIRENIKHVSSLYKKKTQEEFPDWGQYFEVCVDKRLVIYAHWQFAAAWIQTGRSTNSKRVWKSLECYWIIVSSIVC